MNHDAVDLQLKQIHAGTYGNKSVADGRLVLNAALIGDTLRFLRLPAGTKMRPEDFAVKVISPANLGVQMRFGFVYVDGMPGDDAYFRTDSVMGVAALLRGDQAKAAVFIKKDAYVIGTLAGVDLAGNTDIEVSISTEFFGNP